MFINSNTGTLSEDYPVAIFAQDGKLVQVNITDVPKFKKALAKAAKEELESDTAVYKYGNVKVTDEQVIFAKAFYNVFDKWYKQGILTKEEYDIRQAVERSEKDVWDLAENYLQTIAGTTKNSTLWDYTDKTPIDYISNGYNSSPNYDVGYAIWKRVVNIIFDLHIDPDLHHRVAVLQREEEYRLRSQTTPTTGNTTSEPVATTSTTTSGNTPTRSETVTVSVNAPSDLLRLLRVNVTCLDPMKKEYKGEIFTVGNDVIGSVKKYVPFNTTDGWHVPAIIVQQLRDKECQIFQSVKNDKGQEIRTGKTIKAYIVQELPPLTPEELAELAKVQSAQGL